ncbi:OmpA family protein [Roseovarius sp. LXJ103]|uniref:OmpA family protein n=1 Tax=Roseovarius carneus TaxID=2853164 RepID=UPI000D612C58|nr:OmpA family protein [Roseovarius carneus]MBZ8118859.1 OmpA family protein [Roseovarius carneus]PWE35479.1 OmpA family protein [Pelagicola sp. LXJ1103]
MRRHARALALLLAVTALPAAALDLALPGNGTLSREDVEAPGTYPLPVAPWAEGVLPTLEVTGRVVTQAWRIEASGLTTLQVMAPLAAQLDAEGYETLLRCNGQGCGGFDFRFATPVLPAPDMFVDLFDYRFLSARRVGASGPEYITLLISLSTNTAYVQLIHVAPNGAAALSVVTGARPAEAPVAGGMGPARPTPEDLPAALQSAGRVILGDLDFGTGDAQLGDGPFPSLTALGAYLLEDETRRIALVGHTDITGGFDTNAALSLRRAELVAARLRETYGVPSTQIEARGMAYLAPIATNMTAQGREANRRVEAVLVSGP